MEIACITSVAAAKPNVNTSAAHFAVVISLSTILARWKLEKALLYKAAQLKTLLVKRRDGCTVLPRDLWQCVHFNGAKGNNGRQRRSSGATEVPQMCPYEAAIPPPYIQNIQSRTFTVFTHDRKKCSQQCPHVPDRINICSHVCCTYKWQTKMFPMSTHMPERWTFTPQHIPLRLHRKERNVRRVHTCQTERNQPGITRQKQPTPTAHGMWCIKKPGSRQCKYSRTALGTTTDKTVHVHWKHFLHIHIYLFFFWTSGIAYTGLKSISNGTRTRDKPVKESFNVGSWVKPAA